MRSDHVGFHFKHYQTNHLLTEIDRSNIRFTENSEKKLLSYIYSNVSLSRARVSLERSLALPNVSSDFVMTAIPDDTLFTYADRVKDKVVIITG